MNRNIVASILSFNGVKLGQSFAYITDDVAADAVRDLLTSPPPPGTVIEVEYGTGRPETKCYRSESHQVP